MNSLHLLYIESALGIKIKQLTANVAEFVGDLSIEQICEVVDKSGVVFWQNPGCPIVDKAYLAVPVDGQVIEFAVDYNFNCIYIA